MLKKSSNSLRYNYNQISQLAREKSEPVYITKDGEDDLIIMNADAFSKREKVLDLKEKLLIAEEQRLSGVETLSLDDVEKRLRDKIDEKT